MWWVLHLQWFLAVIKLFFLLHLPVKILKLGVCLLDQSSFSTYTLLKYTLELLKYLLYCDSNTIKSKSAQLYWSSITISYNLVLDKTSILFLFHNHSLVTCNLYPDKFFSVCKSCLLDWVLILCLILITAFGAAYGTAKSGVGIAAMSVMRPELIMKSIIPVVMAGIIAIYGLVVAVLIASKLDKPENYSAYR